MFSNIFEVFHLGLQKQPEHQKSDAMAKFDWHLSDIEMLSSDTRICARDVYTV